MAKKLITWLLIPCLLFCFVGVPTAQAVEDDEITEKVLVGFAVVVVGVLVLLGIRSDREWRSDLDDGDVPYYVQNDESAVQFQGDSIKFTW